MSPEYAKFMSRYNTWQNESMIRVSSTLSREELYKTRGAAFRSIPETANHIIWADQIWLSRVADHPGPSKMTIPESTSLYPEWDDYVAARTEMDAYIRNWADGLNDADFEGVFSWFSGAVNREVSQPKAVILLQIFNHQTHHRGQIHAMMTEAGLKPDDTDVPFMPEKYKEM